MAEDSSFGATAHDDCEFAKATVNKRRRKNKKINRHAMGSTAAQTLSEADRAVPKGAKVQAGEAVNCRPPHSHPLLDV